MVLADGELRLDTMPEPIPAPGQMVVRTLVNGICGTDLHAVELMPLREPRVLGHEFCAEVLDYGPSTTVRPFPIGSKVCANPFTDAGDLVSPGGLAEMMVLDVARALPVPEHVAADAAALTEPLAVGIRGVAVGESLGGGAPYVVVGSGPVGLAVILALRALGKGPIIATDLSPVRLAAAAKSGADLVVDAGSDSVWTALEGLGFREQRSSEHLPHPGTGLGITAFECTGVPGMLPTILESVPRHSAVVALGVSAAAETYRPFLGLGKEASIGYSRAYRQDELALALGRIADGTIDTSAMITAKVPLAETPWAFEALRSAEQVKIVVEPNR